MNLLETINLKKYFGDTRAVDNVSLAVAEREFVSLVGPNGAGKTSLINVISALLPSDSGKILFKGDDITQSTVTERVKAGIARSFQIVNLFDDLTAFDNVTLAIFSRQGKTANLAALAHLGYPDMRVPISFALTYPDRAGTLVPSLDLTAGPLEFFEPDVETFRMLALAREAGKLGGTYPCAYNAANEVAVAAFLDGRIGFLEIAAVVENALEHVDGSPARDLDELREADRAARELALDAAAPRAEAPKWV